VKGPVARACWCTLGVEPWVFPYANTASVIGKPHKTLEHLEIPNNPVVEPSLSGETSPPPYRLFRDMAEEEGNAANET
jgi:hypothetical protein